MLGVVLIDFNSYERTIQFIKDLLIATDVHIDGIVIIDNSPGNDNLRSLTTGLQDIGLITQPNNAGEVKSECIQGLIEDTLIVVAKPDDNLGFARANNLGYRILKSKLELEYVLFSNSDIQFIGGKLELSALMDAFEKNHDIGLVGPLVIGLDGRQQSPCRYLSIQSRWWKPTLLWPFFKGAKDPETIKMDKPGHVYRIIGAFMLAKCESYDSIGGFDEHTFLYGEECILAERYKAEGLEVYCDPAVVVIHEGGYTTGTRKKDYSARDRKTIRRLESDIYYYEKYVKVKPYIIKLTRWFTKIYILKLHLKDKIVG